MSVKPLYCAWCGNPIFGPVHMGLTGPNYHSPFCSETHCKNYSVHNPYEYDRRVDITEQDCIDEESTWNR